MHLPNSAELSWFLSGMWAALFILKAGRSSQSGFFAVVALLVVAIGPALGLLYQDQLSQFSKRFQQELHSQ
jgi:hypothetical protein